MTEAGRTRAEAEGALSGDKLVLATRVAWMYFIEGLRQEDIANRLGISRMRVNRLIAAGREEGLVRIEIASPHSGTATLESALVKRFGLREATVIPSPGDPAQLVDCLGHALGMHLNARLRDGMTVGIHHGRMLHALFRGLRPAEMPALTAVTLKGALTPEGRVLPHETVARLALTLGARCYQIGAPAYAADCDEHRVFSGLAMVRAVLERARRCDMAVIAGSRVGPDAGMVVNGFLSAEEAAELRAVGAVGAVLGTFVDAEGQAVDHPVNARRIGLALEDLAAIPEVILVGAEPGKEAVLRAALRRGSITHFMTDERTAEWILAS